MGNKKDSITQFDEQELQLLFDNFIEKLLETRKTFLLLTNASNENNQEIGTNRTRFTVRGQPSVLTDTVHTGLREKNICVPFFCGIATFLEEKGYGNLSFELMSALGEIHPPAEKWI